jgi:hypothetical protein
MKPKFWKLKIEWANKSKKDKNTEGGKMNRQFKKRKKQHNIKG